MIAVLAVFGASSNVPPVTVPPAAIENASVWIVTIAALAAWTVPDPPIDTVPPAPDSRLMLPLLDISVPRMLTVGLAPAAGGVPGPAPPVARTILPLAPALTPASILISDPASIVRLPEPRLKLLCTSMVAVACSVTLPTKLFRIDALSDWVPGSVAAVIDPANVPSSVPTAAVMSSSVGSIRIDPRLPFGADTSITPDSE